MNLLIAIGLAIVLLFAISVSIKLSRKKFAKERIICFFKGHDVSEKRLVQEMGALFNGDICKRCKRFKFGKFVFNYWDESKTVKEGGVTILSGLNPRVQAEGWEIVGDYAQLVEISNALCAKEKKKGVKVLPT